MLTPILVALFPLPQAVPQAPGVAPADAQLVAPIRSLLRVPGGVLDAGTVRALELDVAAVTRTGDVDVIADEADQAALARAGVPFTVVHQDLAAFYASRLTPRAELRGSSTLGAWLSPPFGAGSMGGYYTFTEVVSVLDQIHAAYPTLTTAKFSIGTTIEGRTQWALKISDNPGSDESEPEMRFDAMHHAREPQSMQSTIWLMLALLERYGSDPLSTYLVDSRETWFIPCVNPDGYVHNQTTNPSGGGLWRKNRRANAGGSFGVDLNRNYDYEWGFDDSGSSPTPTSEVYRGTGPASEPEVANMQAFIDSRSFETAISAHTYSDLWLWPWGYIAAAPANNAQYTELGDLCTLETNWVRGPAGAVLYLANGVTDDYDHGVHGTMAFTPEIGGEGDGFWPPTERIIPLAEITEPGFLRTAWAAGAYVHEGSRTTTEVGDGDGFFEAGESYRIVLTARNSGRAASGAVALGLTSTTPGVSVTNGSVGLGTIGSFASASHAGSPLELAIGALVPGGTRVDYVVTITYEGFEQELPGSFNVGEPRLVLTDDLETNLGWTVGAPGDAATTGIWAWANPVGTTNGGQPSNPENDATGGAGVRCFATGNGSTSAGGDDVDGGPTTLVSPRLDLSGLGSAVVDLQRWFANFTVIDDSLEIAVSDDDGATWVPALTVTGSVENSWKPSSFDVQEHVTLSDRVRLRVRTGDQPNNSLTEAAVDEISVVSFDSGPRLNFYGRPVIGGTIAMHVSDAPGQGFAILAQTFSTQSGPNSGGALGIRRSGRFLLPGGTTPANGLARILLAIPNDSSLVGERLEAVAYRVDSRLASNAATLVFQ